MLIGFQLPRYPIARLRAVLWRCLVGFPFLEGLQRASHTSGKKDPTHGSLESVRGTGIFRTGLLNWAGPSHLPLPFACFCLSTNSGDGVVFFPRPGPPLALVGPPLALVGWLVDWLAGRSVGWLAGWLVGCLAGWPHPRHHQHHLDPTLIGWQLGVAGGWFKLRGFGWLRSS